MKCIKIYYAKQDPLVVRASDNLAEAILNEASNQEYQMENGELLKKPHYVSKSVWKKTDRVYIK